jgi:hypothetical protein
MLAPVSPLPYNYDSTYGMKLLERSPHQKAGTQSHLRRTTLPTNKTTMCTKVVSDGRPQPQHVLFYTYIDLSLLLLGLISTYARYPIPNKYRL